MAKLGIIFLSISNKSCEICFQIKIFCTTDRRSSENYLLRNSVIMDFIKPFVKNAIRGAAYIFQKGFYKINVPDVSSIYRKWYKWNEKPWNKNLHWIPLLVYFTWNFWSHILRSHTSAWVFSCKFAAYFQNTFFQEHLWEAASDDDYIGNDKHFWMRQNKMVLITQSIVNLELLDKENYQRKWNRKIGLDGLGLF